MVTGYGPGLAMALDILDRMSQSELRERFDLALRGFLYDVTPRLRVVADELGPLVDALETFVFDGGKRLRPLFCYWGHRATGAQDSLEIVNAAASLELLHACALMHDDVIDESDSRRGAPAVHHRFAALHRAEGWTGDADRFGAAAAILLGDLALVWADAMFTGSGFNAEDYQRAMPVWESMRVDVMCGQYLDVLEQARGGGSVERALRVTQYKTAKYTIEGPLHLGAMLGSYRRDLFLAFHRFGIPLGEAFQLRDDVLGVFGDPAVTGKPAGDDLREGKRTVLVALAEENADPAQRDVLQRLLGDPELDADGIAQLRDVITATGALARAESLITERVSMARAALAAADIDDTARGALDALATATTDRQA
jgi:geranylgeranyl diphosphate synthase type I